MAELIICLQNDVTDLAELQHAHMQYLAETQHHCLMSPTTREVRAIIEPVLQCIVDCTNSCRYVCGTAYALSFVCKNNSSVVNSTITVHHKYTLTDTDKPPQETGMRM